MGLYKPRTQETKQTYEAILAYIQDALGDQVRLFGLGFFLLHFVEASFFKGLACSAIVSGDFHCFN